MPCQEGCPNLKKANLGAVWDAIEVFSSIKYSIRNVATSFAVATFLCLIQANHGHAHDITTVSNPDNYMGILAKINPTWFFSKETQSNIAKTYLCADIAKSSNEFERRDVVSKFFSDAAENAKLLSGVISDVKIDFELLDYDFDKGRFPVALTPYPHENSRRLQGLGKDQATLKCWPNQDRMGSLFPIMVMFQPANGQVKQFVVVSESSAKEMFKNGRPRLRYEFALKVTNFGIGPLGQPRIHLFGDMINPRAHLVDRNGVSLLEIPTNYPISRQNLSAPTSQQPAAPGLKASDGAESKSCDGLLKDSFANTNDAMQQSMNDLKTKNNDLICKSASKAFSQLVAHEQNLKKCRSTLGEAFEKVNSDNSNAIAVTKKQVEFCKKLDEKKAIPSSPWIKVEAEGGGFLAQYLGVSNKKPSQSWKNLIVNCINGKPLVQFLFQKVVTYRAIYAGISGDLDRFAAFNDMGVDESVVMNDDSSRRLYKLLSAMDKHQASSGQSFDITITTNPVEEGITVRPNGFRDMVKKHLPRCTAYLQ